MTPTPEDLLKLIEDFLAENESFYHWFDNLESFCHRYDLNLKYITEILNDPKVIPMIRGKSFEFTVQEYLGKLLDNYDVINPRLNPQSGLHDIDVAVIHKSTSSQYSIECKLAKKDSFKNTSCPTIEIKCMRSRTLGEEAAKRKSQVTGIVASELMIHNDQYIASDFDLVICGGDS